MCIYHLHGTSDKLLNYDLWKSQLSPAVKYSFSVAILSARRPCPCLLSFLSSSLYSSIAICSSCFNENLINHNIYFSHAKGLLTFQRRAITWPQTPLFVPPMAPHCIDKSKWSCRYLSHSAHHGDESPALSCPSWEGPHFPLLPGASHSLRENTQGEGATPSL